jgi:hypothetical protein
MFLADGVLAADAEDVGEWSQEGDHATLRIGEREVAVSIEAGGDLLSADGARFAERIESIPPAAR